MARRRQDGRFFMSKYELIYILPSTLAETEVPAKVALVTEMLTKHGANIGATVDLGKKKLAYPINKDRYGYYHLNEFMLEPAKIKPLEDDLRLSRQLLRHLITQKEIKSEAQLEKERALKEKLAAKRQREELAADAPVPATVPTSETTPISPEELDKKLEKLLEEEPTL
jgi:small subunit ribosomal protein S6